MTQPHKLFGNINYIETVHCELLSKNQLPGGFPVTTSVVVCNSGVFVVAVPISNTK